MSDTCRSSAEVFARGPAEELSDADIGRTAL